ncbi:MAG TPA: hypothetical protein VN851_04270 [Thermoanaerobaculia bacterium]|nr:hypothetical protein [Thermoanaerobaculia bacterium]
MSRRTILPVALFLLLAAVAPPAPAAPGYFASDFFARAWDFLDRLCAHGEGSGPRGIWAENGSCIDPDGRPAGAGCAAVIWSDGGSCIDPNGKPAGAGCSAFFVQADGGSCIDPDGKPGTGCAR